MTTQELTKTNPVYNTGPGPFGGTPARVSAPRRRWQVDGLLIFVTLIWGSTFLVVQNSIKLMGPFTFLALRFAIAALVLGLLFSGQLRRITRLELLTGSFIGLFLFAGYAFQTVGLQYTSSSMAGFMTGLSVVIVPLLSIVVLKQWPGRKTIFGVLLATSGLLLLTMKDGLNFSFSLGELMLLGCALCFAAHILAVGRLAPGKSALNLTVVQIAATALLSLLAAPLAGENMLVMPPGPVWGSAIFMGVIGTAFTLAVMNRVQQFTSSTRAALIYALEPAFAGLIGYWAGEALGPLAVLGCILIFSGTIAPELKLKTGRGGLLARFRSGAGVA